MTFFEWLETVKYEESPVGDFAQDTLRAIKDTKRFVLLPRNGTLEEIDAYFKQALLGDHVYKAFKQAKSRYLKLTNRED